MANSVPEITLTNPHNVDVAPSPLQSPAKDMDSNTSGRPDSSSSIGRPGSSSGSWTSPSNLVRRLSSNTTPASSPAPPAPPEAGTNGATPADVEPAAAMDPLSQHILTRTQLPLSRSATHLTSPPDNGAHGKEDGVRGDRNLAPAVQDPRPPQRTDTDDSSHKEVKKGVKAVSFLSRIMGSTRKRELDETAQDESGSNEGRPEGTEAAVFAQPVDNMGYSPQHPQPPAYIKVRSRNKKEQEFDRLFLAQELECRKKRKLERHNSGNKLRRKSSTTAEANPLWAMEFSKDGRHLAAAGADMIVRVWAVLASPEDRQKHERQEAHESESSGFGVEAEHLSAPVFQSRPVREYDGHTATVLDLSWSKNNFLLSSSMDKTVRLWHVSRSECLCTFKHSDFVPSISFHPKDDRFFLAGSLDSRLRLWSIPDKSVAYMAHVPDMITAVAFSPDGKNAMAGCLNGLCMFYATEGLKYQTQIHVRSTRGQNAKGSKITGIQSYYTASGEMKLLITSNDSRIRLYNFRDKNLELKFKGLVNNSSQIRASRSDCGRYVVCGSEDRKAYIWSLEVADGEKRDKRPVEMFTSHDTITTAVCFAPAKSRQLLSRSDDPVYDLCNPPPVTLMSRAEKANPQQSARRSMDTTSADTDGKFERARPSSAFLARSSHNDGNIIATADFMGKIKIFRQDCAWSKRKQDDWDRASLFSKRTGRSSRRGSLVTKASQRSLRDGSVPSERILSWRQGVASPRHVHHSPSKQASRSQSPSKSFEHRSTPDLSTQSQTPPGASSSSVSELNNPREDNALFMDSGQPNMFWNSEYARKQWLPNGHSHHPLASAKSADEDPDDSTPPDRGHLAVQRNVSYASQLTDERASSDDGEYDDARESPGDRASAQ